MTFENYLAEAGMFVGLAVVLAGYSLPHRFCSYFV